jgi:glycerol-3-phosphate acyltransferase PlsY
VLRSVAFVALAYLVGSVPTGVLLARRAGVDVRRAGSGNIGATNVARTAGRVLGLLTLVGDVAKGFGPVAAARWSGEDSNTVAVVAIAAIVGHLFSVFLRFQGGKGVATGFGVLLGLAPSAAWAPLVVFLIALAARQIVSLASLAAAASAPIVLWAAAEPPATVVASVAIALLVYWRHRENIQRLLAGTEAPFRARS